VKAMLFLGRNRDGSTRRCNSEDIGRMGRYSPTSDGRTIWVQEAKIEFTVFVSAEEIRMLLCKCPTDIRLMALLTLADDD
jgi:hypothetical protein